MVCGWRHCPRNSRPETEQRAVSERHNALKGVCSNVAIGRSSHCVLRSHSREFRTNACQTFAVHGRVDQLFCRARQRVRGRGAAEARQRVRGSCPHATQKGGRAACRIPHATRSLPRLSTKRRRSYSSLGFTGSSCSLASRSHPRFTGARCAFRFAGVLSARQPSVRALAATRALSVSRWLKRGALRPF